MEVVLSLLAVFLAALLCSIAAYKYCYQPFLIFKKHNIPGPPPLPFFGNILLVLKVGFIGLPEYVTSKYGEVCGVYVGCRPLMIVKDTDILKKVFVDNFETFIDREALPGFFNEAVGLPQGLFTARDKEWKRSRKVVAPAFSAMNMRQVAGSIIETCQKLQNAFQEYADTAKSVEVSKLVEKYVMESTVAIVFGDIAEKDAKIFAESARALWSAVDESTLILLWFTLAHFPWMGKIIGALMRFTSKGRYFWSLYRTCDKLVRLHRKKKNITIVQLLLEAQVEENGQTRRMTHKEVESQLITFLMAGLDTTSTTVSCTAYLLAINPQAQQKAHSEIQKYFNSKPSASLIEAAQEIEYMEMVVLETLRLLPPVVGISRLCNETITLNGVTIPKGATVYATYRENHLNPRYWDKPEEFIPERFTAEERAKRPPAAYTPFGIGPRNCVGARFTVLVIKMMLIQTLRTLRFVQAPDTEVPLKMSYHLSASPSNSISLRVESW